MGHKCAKCVLVAIYILLLNVIGSSLAFGEEDSTALASVDRIVDNTFAVVLVGPNEREWIVPLEVLAHFTPSASPVEGIWIHLEFTEWRGNRRMWLIVDPLLTDSIRQRVAAKLKMLRERSAITSLVDRGAVDDLASQQYALLTGQ